MSRESTNNIFSFPVTPTEESDEIAEMLNWGLCVKFVKNGRRVSVSVLVILLLMKFSLSTLVSSLRFHDN
jgi:ribosomal protein S5